MANPTIFISYNRKDGAMAKRIGAAFRDAGFAISAVKGSTTDPDALKQELVSKINGAECVVALVSPDSIASKRCRAEIGYATKREKPVIPALVEGREVPAQFADAPYALTDASDNEIQDFVTFVKNSLSVDEEDEDEYEDLLDSLDDDEDEDEPADRLMPGPDVLRQYQRDTAPLPVPTTPRRPRQAGSLWVAPGGGPSNFVLTLAVAALILIVAFVIVFYVNNNGGSTTQIPNDWNRYESAAISIAAPPGWGQIADDDIQEAGGPFSTGSFDPGLFGVGELEDTRVEIALVDSDPDAGAAFIVMSALFPDGMSLADLTEMGDDFSGGAEDFGFGAGEFGMVDLPVGESLKVGITMEFMPGAGIEMIFYLNEKYNRLFMAIWMAGTGEVGPGDKVLDTMMQSYRIK